MVSELNEVEQLFLSRSLGDGKRIGGTILFSKHIALEFVEECKKRKIPILGIDSFLVGKNIQPTKGFTITEKSVQPIQDYSIDFSLPPFKYDVYNVDEIYYKSTTLIKESPDHVYFEIACGS